MRALVYAVPVALAASALMMANTASWTAGTDYAEMGGFRRLWSDLALGSNAFLDDRFPLNPGDAAAAAARDAVEAYRPLIVERTQRGDIRPWTPWRTMGVRPFLRERAQRAPQLYDDPGRARLLALGFDLLGGVAPFLILWLGLLVALPALWWLVFEGVGAGHTRAVAVAALAFACWPFFLETLALPRYPVGFYLVGVLGLCAYGVGTCLGRLTPRGLLWRTAGAGVLLALCALCRSSVIVLLPGFVCALIIGVRRLRGFVLCDPGKARIAALGGLPATASPLPPRPPKWPGRLVFLAVPALVVLVLPYLLVRPSERHGVWSALWEGLGDFDRTHGHAWSDPVAEKVSQDAGGGALWTPASEAVFRRLVLDDVRHDPLWYAGILLRRTGATLVQWKLWPRRASAGAPIRRSTSDNEGFMDKYYGYAATADHLGLLQWRMEVPVAFMLLPVVLLVGLALRGPARETARGALAVVGAVALGTVGVPILISTAAAQEAQAFAFVYVMAGAFCVDEGISFYGRARGRARSTPRGEA